MMPSFFTSGTSARSVRGERPALPSAELGRPRRRRGTGEALGADSSRPIQELVNSLCAVEAVPRPFWCADVPDGGSVDDALGHLVGQGLGVFETDEAAELG